MKILTIILLLTVSLISCDGGLAPNNTDVENKTGFGGTISFIGDWPSDITRTNIVLFQDPILTEADFNINNLKYLSTSIPLNSSDYSYDTIDSVLFGNVTSGKYSYLAVIQSKAENISFDRKDWFVVGVYESSVQGAKPGEIEVEENKFNFEVNITCDFDNLPPQPPGGE